MPDSVPCVLCTLFHMLTTTLKGRHCLFYPEEKRVAWRDKPLAQAHGLSESQIRDFQLRSILSPDTYPFYHIILLLQIRGVPIRTQL